MTDSFDLAQQAANVAYDMTLEQGGDMAQASDDYKAVMSAYHAQADMRPGYIVKRQAEVTELTDYRKDWLTQGDVERIWNEAEPEAY